MKFRSSRFEPFGEGISAEDEQAAESFFAELTGEALPPGGAAAESFGEGFPSRSQESLFFAELTGEDLPDLRRPIKVIQKTDTTCWAAALESLFLTTWPFWEMSVKRPLFEQRALINRIKVYEKTPGELVLTRTDMLDSLRTEWPGLAAVKRVYKEILALHEPWVIADERWNLIRGKLEEGAYVMLSFNTPAMRGSGGWTWHSYIISGLLEGNGRKLARVMDPADGSLKNVELPDTWAYYMTWRFPNQPLPGWFPFE
jgi:hypothetical protein